TGETARPRRWWKAAGYGRPAARPALPRRPCRSRSRRPAPRAGRGPRGGRPGWGASVLPGTRLARRSGAGRWAGAGLAGGLPCGLAGCLPGWFAGPLPGGLAVGRRRFAALAPLTPALLAVLLGMGLGRGFPGFLLVDLGRIGQLGAVGLVEAQLGHRVGEVLGQFGGDVQRGAVRVLDDQAAGMKVHLAADRAGEECRLAAVFAVAHDGVADRRHVDAQLVGAAGQRLEFHPGGAVARAVKHAIAGAGGLALSAFVDHHLLAAGARLL